MTTMANLVSQMTLVLLSLLIKGCDASYCYFSYYYSYYYCYYYYSYSLAGGTIAGIVIGCIVFVGLCIAACVVCCIKATSNSSRGTVVRNPNMAGNVAVVTTTAAQQGYAMQGYTQPPPAYGAYPNYPAPAYPPPGAVPTSGLPPSYPNSGPPKPPTLG
ncbi:uncharacterized protein LOC135470532 [Liolophura sinensis]|uniref:uncharacterized protein LOC135470532 n=1 Tax=Liolophura sinensis TaxID=3198878 RepID=UPI0031591607